MALTTRTLNPLPFGDLEPHRFEDLVRQVAYDFRLWRSLEATGRSGSDEGMDIRGMERIGPESAEVEPRETEDGPEEEVAAEEPEDTAEKLWVIQCKREKSIGPQKIASIIKDFISEGGPVPYGYVLAAACDFSVKARREAADLLRAHGVQEVHLWGKGELEDMLFQPKNDHILFAYFGISLQVRRRSMRTNLRSNLTLKRKLVKELGDLRGFAFKTALIRDPRDEDYPYIKSEPEFLKTPAWRYWQFHAHEPPDHVSFVTVKYFAYVNWETEEWDIIKDFNEAIPHHPELCGLQHNSWDPDGKSQVCRAYWELHVREQNRAWAMEVGSIPYERIMLCDELGDHYHEGPHLLIEYTDGQPFSGFFRWIEANNSFSHRHLWNPEESKRISFFPKPIPDEREKWFEEMRKRSEEHEKS